MGNWVPAESVSDGADGTVSAFVGGKWVPAAKIADGEGGKKLAFIEEAQESSQTPVPSGVPEQPKPDNGPVEAQKHTTGEKMADFGTKTAVGGVLGTFAPELVTAGGLGLSAIPGLQVPGAMIISAGRAMRLGRLAGAVTGAISGATSSIAGQAMRELGATESGVLAGELAGGVLTPGASIITNFIPRASKSAWNIMMNLSERQSGLASRGAREGKDVIQGAFKGKLPEHDLYSLIKTGTEIDAKATEAAASDIMAKAYAEASKVPAGIVGPRKPGGPATADSIITDAKARVEALRKESSDRIRALRDSSGGKLEAADRVGKQAETSLHNTIGVPMEMSDIGTKLSQSIEMNKTAAKNVLKQTDNQLRAVRDSQVAALEQQGKFITSVPETQALLKEIDQKLLLTQAGREASKITTDSGTKIGRAAVTEPGVARAYQSVKDAVQDRRIAVEFGPDGQPTKFETFRTSFEALDAVRRKVQKAAFGKEAEGYEALGQTVAKDLYGKLSKAQESYLGGTGAKVNIQRELQNNYTKGLETTAQFEERMGRMALDPDKSPASLTKNFFKDSKGVEDLISLTGNRQLVENMAESYVARNLAGKSSEQAKTWLKSKENTDWLRSVQGGNLTAKAEKYVENLTQIETREGFLSSKAGERAAQMKEQGKAARAESAKIMEKAQEQAGKVTQERQADIVKTADLKASGLRKEAEAKAKSLVGGGGFDAQKVHSTLLSGPVEQLPDVFRYVAGTPGGQTAIEGSVRQALSTVSAGRLRTVWEGRLKVAMEAGRVLPRDTMTTLDNDIQRAYEKMEPKAAQPFVKRLIETALRNSVSTTGGIGASRGAIGLDRMMSKE